jgi:hypothetical protein
MAKELKKKQKDLKENSTGNLFQRARFTDLGKLFSAKSALLRLESSAGGEGEGKAGEANLLEVL